MLGGKTQESKCLVSNPDWGLRAGQIIIVNAF